MDEVFTIRAIVFEYERVAGVEASSKSQGLAAWLTSLEDGRPSVTVSLNLYKTRRVGVLAQRVGATSVRLLWDPVIELREVLGYSLCRYHEGEPGKPWEHVYCTRVASTKTGYCSLHSRSPKALYELCAQGVDRACTAIASLPEKFTVYALDYGGSRLKIGLTQSWRLVWRVAEQPHVSAVKIYEEGIVKARELEKTLGHQRTATEGLAARIAERTRLAARFSAELPRNLSKYASRLALMLSSLGLTGSYNAFSIQPLEHSPEEFTSLPQLELLGLVGKRVRIVDYWAGILVVEHNGVLYTIPKNQLLHVAVKGRVEGEKG